jgi:hypothetical protein
MRQIELGFQSTGRPLLARFASEMLTDPIHIPRTDATDFVPRNRRGGFSDFKSGNSSPNLMQLNQHDSPYFEYAGENRPLPAIVAQMAV